MFFLNILLEYKYQTVHICFGTVHEKVIKIDLNLLVTRYRDNYVNAIMPN